MHFDLYALRNLAMFLYPLFGVYIYRHYHYPKLTPYIAWSLLIFIIFSGGWHKFIERPLSFSKAIEVYKQTKQDENAVKYLPMKLTPQGYCPVNVKRTMGGDHASNMVFRVLIWQDMIKELIDNRAWLGFGLSHPLRSPQIEELGWAKPEWLRDGWISAHNSYLYVIYRSGIVGAVALGWLLFALYGAFLAFWRSREEVGLALVFCVSYWLICACFQEQWQLPYNAIPFWVCVGLIFNRSKWLKNSF